MAQGAGNVIAFLILRLSVSGSLKNFSPCIKNNSYLVTISDKLEKVDTSQPDVKTQHS